MRYHTRNTNKKHNKSDKQKKQARNKERNRQTKYNKTKTKLRSASQYVVIPERARNGKRC